MGAQFCRLVQWNERGNHKVIHVKSRTFSAIRAMFQRIQTKPNTPTKQNKLFFRKTFGSLCSNDVNGISISNCCTNMLPLCCVDKETVMYCQKLKNEKKSSFTSLFSFGRPSADDLFWKRVDDSTDISRGSKISKSSTKTEFFRRRNSDVEKGDNKFPPPRPELTLNEDERRCLQIHFRETLLEQHRYIFHKTMLMAIESSPKLNEIIGCEKFCHRDFTKWPKLHSLCQAQQKFYERLIYEMGLNSEMCYDVIYALGRTHYSYAKFGMKPHFLDIWQLRFETFTDKCKFQNAETKTKFNESMRKLNTFVNSIMNLAYSKAQQEKLGCKLDDL